jgi:ATP-binding cassette subfamily B protein/subfamily B ATP-binding cassette protein MsbA
MQNHSSARSDENKPLGPAAKTSRERFQQFVQRFKDRFQGEDEPDSQDRDKGNSESKRKRRGYLKLYIARLWPHWRMVLLLASLAIVVAGLELCQPLFARYIIDQVLLGDLTAGEKFWRLNQVGAMFLAVIVLTRIAGVTRAWNQRLLDVRVVLTLRRALFERLMKLPLEKLSEMKVGGVISRLTDDINKTTGLLQMAVVSPGVAALRLLMAMGILFFLNWKLALTALGILPPIILLSMIAVRRIRPIYRTIRKAVSKVDGRVGEAFQGIRAVRSFAGESREFQEFTVSHHHVTRMRMFAARREIILWSTWGFLMALIGVVITWAGGYWYLNDQINGTPEALRTTIGDISAFQFYTLLLLQPVWQIVESMTELQRSLASMERVFEVLGSPVDKPDRSNAIEADPQVESISFDGVWFSYKKESESHEESETNSQQSNQSRVKDDKQDQDDNDRYVIRDFSLHVPAGSTVALVGRSGAGKTTITDLVARFYDPTKGQISLNGIDLRDYQLDSFRRLIGIVQQDVFLFDGTVFENIAYGSRNATLEQVVEAARQANADEFISELPEQYDSIIGELGVKLSGGQRQRLSIARALLADPQILILDEATSNLDTESEQLIHQSMTTLLKDRTTFVIAHRLSTITHADIIVVMDEGQIVETGTHEELLSAGETYSQMVHRQHDAVSLL